MVSRDQFLVRLDLWLGFLCCWRAKLMKTHEEIIRVQDVLNSKWNACLCNKWNRYWTSKIYSKPYFTTGLWHLFYLIIPPFLIKVKVSCSTIFSPSKTQWVFVFASFKRYCRFLKETEIYGFFTSRNSKLLHLHSCWLVWCAT